MSGRYERVNTHDQEEPESPTRTVPRSTYPGPNSPPPSYRSRASSRDRANNAVDPDLADAFDDDASDSDDDADDRQRAPTTRRIYGSGIQSDGVFSNLSAKPDRGDNEKEEAPPSYEQAAADQAPPYWETTILAPGLAGPDDVYIDGLPVGTVFSFVWNGMVSMAFQLVGFLLTYLLHSTHAAKQGSRAGLGITLIQYGFYMKSAPPPPSSAGGGMHGEVDGEGYARPADPNAHDFSPDDVNGQEGGGSGVDGADWAAWALMIVGWFILIRASPDRGLGVPVIAVGEEPGRVV
ncbi:hypothetical protein VTJ49DRAFT_1704 [Mycothermus thermophilus]|uniref:Metal homeostatis protein bsd2 n=1 Tax=Humicola insolens TaxID=85995 RepID=A0ABR3VCN2_HUMIN